MHRRPVLHALAVACLTGLAGCNALSRSRSHSTSTAELTASAEQSSESVPTDGPYRAPGAPLLDRSRGINVRNLGSTDRFVTVVLTAGSDRENHEIFAASRSVPAGEAVSFADLLATGGSYEVLVETAAGTRRRYEWVVRADLDDLWVDLTPDVSFRRPVVSTLDSPFALDADQHIGYEVPPAVGVPEALGRVPALALDNDTADTVRTRLHIWDGGQLYFASSFDFPPDVRALVPVLPASRRYDIVLRTDGGDAIYDWQPSVRNTLYATLAPPEFRCGYAYHDLRVRNETPSEMRVAVEVRTGDQSLFARTLAVDAASTVTVPSAVDPAGPLEFVVETPFGEETYNWVRCAPNGPITVTVRDSGVSVAIRPLGESG